MSLRREYPVRMMINGIFITKVIIDPHYEVKHSGSISDELILELVKTLDGDTHEENDRKDSFLYFVKDNIMYKGKNYKLIWLLEDNEVYVGVINAYRRG